MGNSPAVDRHVLMGLFALHNQFIDRPTLLTALRQWKSNPAKSFSQILLDQNALQPNHLGLLQALVDAHSEQRGEKMDSPLASFGLGESLEEVIQALEHHEKTQCKNPFCETSAGRDRSKRRKESNGNQTLTALHQFELLRPHAQGALGVVSVALDYQLNREVALKELKADHANDPTHQVRFRQEAEINGGLEHPNIVPVYALGSYPDGRPYYAMRMIRGETLQAAAERFHRNDSVQRSSNDRNLQMQELLRSFVNICHAIDYAHSRGILHRDLKPANIMLGAYGETLVVDWGVAKPIDGLSEPSREEIKLDPPSSENSAPTLEGALVGTLEYMSPEQVSGGQRLDTTTDIYGLGATLFVILTGKLPFPYKENIVERIQKGMFPRPSQVKKEVPPALEAVCLKAMARQPSQRYASAQLLADEIKHWLANEEVSVYRAPWSARLGKWLWRWRAWMSGLAALVLTTLMASLVALVFLNQEKDNTEKQRKEALAEKNEATHQLLRANLADYRNKIFLAQNQWNLRKPAQAWDLLKLCPPNLRGWEHSYLVTWFHQSPNILGTTDANHPSSLALSADGKRIARSYFNERIEIWDFEDEQNRYLLESKQAPVTCLEFFPTGNRLVSGLSSGDLTIWDLNRKNEGSHLQGHAKEVSCVAVSPDGQWLASGGMDNQIIIWDPATGKEVTRLEGHPGGVICLQIRSDGQRLASGGKDGSIKIWDSRSWKLLKTLTDHRGSVNTLAFSPEVKHLASGSSDKTVKFWDYESGNLIRTLSAQPFGIRYLKYSTDGQRLVAFTHFKGFKLWDCATGTEILTLKGLNNPFPSLAVHSEGNRLNVGTFDRRLQIWDETPNTGELNFTGHTNRINAMAFSPDGQRVVSGGEDQNLIVWDVRTRKALLTWKAHNKRITSIVYHPDGKRIVSGSEDHSIKIWDASDGKEIKTLTGHTANVNHLAFNPDGTTLVSGGQDNRLILWDGMTGNLIHILEGHQGPISCLAFNSIGNQLVSGSEDKHLILWDTQSRKQLVTLEGHSEPVTCVAFSPDRKRIVSGGLDNKLILWDASTGKPIANLDGHSARVLCAAFSPDGLTIASGGFDRTLRTWNGIDGSRKAVFGRNQSAVACLAFNHQGNRIFIGGGDPEVKMIDANTGEEFLSLPANSAPVLGLLFSPDGKRLIGRNLISASLTLWDASREDCPGESGAK